MRAAPLLVDPATPMPDIRQVVAWHESAHATVARALGYERVAATIIPGPDYAGQFWSGEPSPSGESIRRNATSLCASVNHLMTPLGASREWAGDWVINARAEVMVAVAGPVGECIKFGREITSRERGTDGPCARAYAETVAYSPEAVQAFIQYCEVEVEAILKRYWRSVEAVAAALLERGTLDGAEIDTAIAHGIMLDEAAREHVRRRAEAARVERARMFTGSLT